MKKSFSKNLAVILVTLSMVASMMLGSLGLSAFADVTSTSVPVFDSNTMEKVNTKWSANSDNISKDGDVYVMDDSQIDLEIHDWIKTAILYSSIEEKFATDGEFTNGKGALNNNMDASMLSFNIKPVYRSDWKAAIYVAMGASSPHNAYWGQSSYVMIDYTNIKVVQNGTEIGSVGHQLGGDIWGTDADDRDLVIAKDVVNNALVVAIDDNAWSFPYGEVALPGIGGIHISTYFVSVNVSNINVYKNLPPKPNYDSMYDSATMSALETKFSALSNNVSKENGKYILNGSTVAEPEVSGGWMPLAAMYSSTEEVFATGGSYPNGNRGAAYAGVDAVLYSMDIDVLGKHPDVAIDLYISIGTANPMAAYHAQTDYVKITSSQIEVKGLETKNHGLSDILTVGAYNKIEILVNESENVLTVAINGNEFDFAFGEKALPGVGGVHVASYGGDLRIYNVAAYAEVSNSVSIEANAYVGVYLDNTAAPNGFTANDECVIFFATIDCADMTKVSEYGIIVGDKTFKADTVNFPANNGKFGIALYGVPAGTCTATAYVVVDGVTIYSATAGTAIVG